MLRWPRWLTADLRKPSDKRFEETPSLQKSRAIVLCAPIDYWVDFLEIAARLLQTKNGRYSNPKESALIAMDAF